MSLENGPCPWNVIWFISRGSAGTKFCCVFLGLIRHARPAELVPFPSSSSMVTPAEKRSFSSIEGVRWVEWCVLCSPQHFHTFHRRGDKISAPDQRIATRKTTRGSADLIRFPDRISYPSVQFFEKTFFSPFCHTFGGQTSNKSLKQTPNRPIGPIGRREENMAFMGHPVLAVGEPQGFGHGTGFPEFWKI